VSPPTLSANAIASSAEEELEASPPTRIRVRGHLERGYGLNASTVSLQRNFELEEDAMTCEYKALIEIANVVENPFNGSIFFDWPY
jgi:hypothetical protein